MIQGELPPISDQLDLLRLRGEQFRAEERQVARAVLPGIFMESDGTPALYDTRIIPHIPSMIVSDPAVCHALEGIRDGHSTTQSTTTFIDKLRNTAGLIIGFSGYGTEGRYYGVEQDGIEAVLTGSKEAGLPIDLVVDGGTGYGVPGLSGVLANVHGYSTLGCTPLRGLRGAAPRDNFVVIDQEFGHEARVLGASSDVLFALGGGPIAREEILSALRRGSKVVFLTRKTYPDSSAAYLHERHPRAKSAYQSGQLEVFKTVDQLAAFLGTLSISSVKANRGRRANYLKRLSKLASSRHN